MTSVSADNYEKSIKINGREYELILAKIIPNASETLVDNPDGEPIVSMIVTKNMMKQETLLFRRVNQKPPMEFLSVLTLHSLQI